MTKDKPVLFSEKPYLPKSETKKLKAQKWELADQYKKELEALGYKVFIFPASKDTPHMRCNYVDLWPATGRWLCLHGGVWGVGFEDYKKYLALKYSDRPVREIFDVVFSESTPYSSL